MTDGSPPGRAHPDRVVIDTNVFVGAAFNPSSHSAALVRAVREQRLSMPWSDDTRAEVERVLRKIPPLSWSDFQGLFRAGEHHPGSPDERGLAWVADPDDRKFAALARAVGAVLVSNDEHLLARRAEATITVLTPHEYGER
jgi:predicted nucleic acid-binding protein